MEKTTAFEHWHLILTEKKTAFKHWHLILTEEKAEVNDRDE